MAGGDPVESPGTEITLQAISRRNLEPSLHQVTGERLAQSLLLLRTVRLDRERITTIRNLETVRDIHSLYLQENLIKKIENLDALRNLRFLSLSGNRIKEVLNLRSLQNLQFLDLSHNLIQRLNEEELPPTLIILDLRENRCTKEHRYRQKVMEALPLLQELDGESVQGRDSQDSPVREEEEDDSDSDSLILTCIDSGSLSSVHQEMLERSHRRREKAMQEHQDRLEELSETKVIDPSVSPEKNPWLPALSEIDLCSTKTQPASSTMKHPHTLCDRNPVSFKQMTNASPQKDLQNYVTSVRDTQVSANKYSSKAKTTPSKSTYGTGRGSLPEEGRSRLVPNKTSSSGKLSISVPNPKLQTTATSIGRSQSINASPSTTHSKRTATTTPVTGKNHSVTSPTASPLPEKTPIKLLKSKASEREGRKK